MDDPAGVSFRPGRGDEGWNRGVGGRSSTRRPCASSSLRTPWVVTPLGEVGILAPCIGVDHEEDGVSRSALGVGLVEAGVGVVPDGTLFDEAPVF